MNQKLQWILLLIVTLFILNLSHWYYEKKNGKHSTIFYKIIGKSMPPHCPSLPTSERNLDHLNKSVNGIWTIVPNGRLGNVLGEFAALYALAKMNGYQPYLLPGMHNSLSKMFKIQLPVLSYEATARIQWRTYHINNWMMPEYKTIRDPNVKIIGVVSSWTFHHHIKTEILHQLTFHDFITEEANAYLAKVRGDRKNVTFIGVHVRRGDYIRLMSDTIKGVLADKAYMQKAMDYFRNKYANPIFVVSSNGMDWCKENINTSLGDVHFAGNGAEGSPDRDFALLSHCNHTIMTMGTFGNWIAYLVGGETVYLANFTVPDSIFLKYVHPESTFLPEWIGIPADLSPLFKNNADKPAQKKQEN